MNFYSDWYPLDTAPIRPGVYQVRDRAYQGIEATRWDGNEWRYMGGAPRLLQAHHVWRGLSFNADHLVCSPYIAAGGAAVINQELDYPVVLHVFCTPVAKKA